MTVTQETSAPLFVVVGATGVQGGSVLTALVESEKSYRIRALTRDPSKPAAKNIAVKGVEVVQANLTVENKEQVVKAFEGATYAFIVTNFWEHLDVKREVAEGTMMFDAAKAANVKLVIWTGLPNANTTSNGKYTHIEHFDGKADITAHAKKIGIRFFDVECGCYMQNYLSFWPPRKQPDGSYALISTVPAESILPMVDAVADYGMFVREAVESPRGQKAETGDMIVALGELISWGDLAKQLGEITGKNVKYLQVTQEQYNAGITAAGQPESVAIELGEMCAYFDAVFQHLPQVASPGESRKYLPRKPVSWAEFVKKTDWSSVLN